MAVRVKLWDNLKCFLIVAVVIGHLVDLPNKPNLCKSIYLFMHFICHFFSSFRDYFTTIIS